MHGDKAFDEIGNIDHAMTPNPVRCREQGRREAPVAWAPGQGPWG